MPKSLLGIRVAELYCEFFNLHLVKYGNRKKLWLDKILFELQNSDVTLLFKHLPNWVSEIEHFQIFSRPRENQLPKSNQLAYVLSRFLIFGVSYANMEEFKLND